MRIVVTKHAVIVHREPGDVRLHNESQLLYRVKLALNKQGCDLIKKLMSKDGHLVSDTVHYLRTRSRKKNVFCIWNANYQISDAAEDLWVDGKVALDRYWLDMGERN